MLLADQNDEDRLFQVHCFFSNMEYNHVMDQRATR